jgi:hypothetical protein
MARILKMAIVLMIVVMTVAIAIAANRMVKVDETAAMDEAEKSARYKAAVFTVTGRAYQSTVGFLEDLKMRIESFWAAEKNEQKKRDAQPWQAEKQGILDN